MMAARFIIPVILTIRGSVLRSDFKKGLLLHFFLGAGAASLGFLLADDGWKCYQENFVLRSVEDWSCARSRLAILYQLT